MYQFVTFLMIKLTHKLLTYLAFLHSHLSWVSHTHIDQSFSHIAHLFGLLIFLPGLPNPLFSLTEFSFFVLSLILSFMFQNLQSLVNNKQKLDSNIIIMIISDCKKRKSSQKLKFCTRKNASTTSNAGCKLVLQFIRWLLSLMLIILNNT